MGGDLATFQAHFVRWVESHNRPSPRRPEGFAVVPDQLYETLREQIPETTLELIGNGLTRGWLATADDGRGYFVRETARDSPPQPTVYHSGVGKVIPWWELYVQLGDYVRLRRVAEHRGLVVRMEDRQMDLVVWADERLVLYVENKVTAAATERLLTKMRAYGEAGFDLKDNNRGNDPLRKAMYLFQKGCRPQYFGLSALGCERLFEVQYLGPKNRFL